MNDKREAHQHSVFTEALGGLCCTLRYLFYESINSAYVMQPLSFIFQKYALY